MYVLVPAKQWEVSDIILLNKVEKVTMAGQFIVDLTTVPPPLQCAGGPFSFGRGLCRAQVKGSKPEPASQSIFIRVLME